MQQIVRNPVDGIYAATPDYVHALEVRQPSGFSISPARWACGLTVRPEDPR
jgi:hypothetical protein